MEQTAIRQAKSAAFRPLGRDRSTAGDILQLRLQAEQIDSLFRSPIPMVTNMVNAAIVCAVLLPEFQHMALVVWVGLMVAVNLGRLYLRQRYQRTRPPLERARHWGLVYTAGAGLSGVLWGLVASVLFVVDSILYHAFVVVAVGGMGAGAVATSAVYLPAFFAYLVPATVPLAIFFLMQGQAAYIALGVMGALYIALISLTARSFNRSLLRSFKLRIDKADLADELSAAWDFAESVAATFHHPTVILDSDLNVVSASPAFYDVFEATSKESERQPFFEVGAGMFDRSDLRQRLGRIVQREIEFETFEIDVTLPNAEIANILVDARMLRGLTKDDQKILVTLTDITELRRAEAELRMAHDDLQHRVARRTVELQTANRALIEENAERKRAEDALRLSEERLTQATRLAKLGHWVWDAIEDRCIYCSEEHARIHGLSVEDYISKASTIDGEFGLTHPDDREKYKAALMALRVTKGFEVEYRVVTPEGETRYVREVVRPVFDDAGVVIQQFGTIQDITDRKTTEVALQESEAQLRLVTDNVPALIAYVDENERYVFANKVHEKWFERPLAEILGKSVDRVLETSVYAQLRPNIGKALKGESQSFEVATHTPDGSPRHFRLNFVPHTGFDGGVRGFFALVRNITRHREAEQALRESEDRYRNLFESAPIAIREEDFSKVKAHVDALDLGNAADFKTYLDRHPAFVEECTKLVDLVDANQAVLRLHNAAGKNCFIANFGKHFSEEALDAFKKVLVAVRENRTHLEFETRVERADGSKRDVSSRWSVAAGHEKTYARVLLTSFDITERKRTEEQLRQAQKMEAVGQLTGGMAHDFNNLLGVILANLELLSADLGEGLDYHEYIAPAVRAANRGAELTSRLLAFSRRHALRPELLDLNQLVSGMTGLLERTLGETIEIETRLDANPMNVTIDRTLMETTLLNLAINARHAMPDGGRLVLETEGLVLGRKAAGPPNGEMTGPCVMLSVTDTGSGMPPEVAAQVFEPFFTTKEAGEGSGLGLSMVYGYIKQSGGQAEIDSEVGRGTTLKLCLPRSPCTAKVPSPAKVERKEVRGGSETILLVEDDPDLRKLAASVLGRLGYHVLARADGTSALAALDETAEIHLLFTDVVLSQGMDGVALAREAMARNPDLKVIFTTGYVEDAESRKRIVDKDAVLLAKPYRSEDLARQIRQALDGDRA